MSSQRWNDPAPGHTPGHTLPQAPGRTRIKICGLSESVDIEAAAEAGADAIGLVLAENSSRSISPARAAALTDAADPRLTVISLMVDPSEHQVESRSPGWIQLHGSEDAHLVQRAAELGPVIRAVPFDDIEAIGRWDADPNVARLLIDGHRGGSGIEFDHDAFAELAASIVTPWILAGGLNPDTVAAAIERLHPWGVDVSSGVESTRGLKDPKRIAAFCQAVQAVHS